MLTQTKLGTRLPLDELNAPDYSLIQVDTELAEALSYVPAHRFSGSHFKGGRRTVTGAVVVVGDGEYTEIWVNADPFPYSVHCVYTRLL